MVDEAQIGDITWKLWQGGRLVIKHLVTDRRVRFASWHEGSSEGGTRSHPLPTLLEGHAGIRAPTGLSSNVVRKYATLFGLFTTFQPEPGTAQFGKSTYTVTCTSPDSAVAAHQVTLDSDLGEVTCESACGGMEVSLTCELFLQEHPSHQETGDCWRLTLGKLRGAAEALSSENQRLTADNLQHASE